MNLLSQLVGAIQGSDNNHKPEQQEEEEEDLESPQSINTRFRTPAVAWAIDPNVIHLEDNQDKAPLNLAQLRKRDKNKTSYDHNSGKANIEDTNELLFTDDENDDARNEESSEHSSNQSSDNDNDDDDEDKSQNGEARREKNTLDQLYSYTRRKTFTSHKKDGSEDESEENNEQCNTEEENERYYAARSRNYDFRYECEGEYNDFEDFETESEQSDEYVKINSKLVHRSDFMRKVLKNITYELTTRDVDNLNFHYVNMLKEKPGLWNDSRQLTSLFARGDMFESVRFDIDTSNKLFQPKDADHYEANIVDCCKRDPITSTIISRMSGCNISCITIKYVSSNDFKGDVDICIDPRKGWWVTYNRRTKVGEYDRDTPQSAPNSPITLRDLDVEKQPTEDLDHVVVCMDRIPYSPRSLSVFKESKLWAIYVSKTDPQILDSTVTKLNQKDKDGNNLVLLKKNLLTTTLVTKGSEKDAKIGKIRAKCMATNSITHFKVTEHDVNILRHSMKQHSFIGDINDLKLYIRSFDGSPINIETSFTMSIAIEYRMRS